MTASAFSRRFPSESDTVEFKQGLSSIQESIVAFSNALGGVILVGVRDNGAIHGLECTPAVEDKIHYEAANAHSIGRLCVRPLEVDGRSITVIGIGQLREGFAQTSSGRVLCRLGTRRPALIGAQLVRFMQERMSSTFEAVTLDVAFADANPQLVADVVAALGIAQTARVSERLAERGLLSVDAPKPMLTIAGALYLLPRPDRVLGKSYIEIRRFPDGEPEFDRREEIFGPLHEQVVEATHEVMREVGSDSVVIGLRRHELARLPERVVREAIANAVAHRSYEQHGTPVRIDVHRDRTEIASPGGLLAPVTVETMRDSCAARNADVLRVLRAFRLAEDSGKGVDVIEDVMRDELLDRPTFSATESSVSVVLPVLGGTRPEERAWLQEVVTHGGIEDRDRVLLVHARRGEVLSNTRARELVGIGRDAATAALRRLVDAGLLQRSGRRGGTRYQLAAHLTPPAGSRLGREELLALVLEMARAQPVTNSTIRERTGLDRQDALSLLAELVSSGRLLRLGARRGTRYEPTER
ncbi:MAG: ATP-binding protein [Solirubrobacteraceae bacterium]